MTYHDHSLISARKFNCNPKDTIRFHKLLDDSKLFLPHWQHRVFSHNTYLIYVITQLTGETVENTKTGGQIMVRDILMEHMKEDHNGKCPTPQDWAECITFNTTEGWINRPDPKELHWLKKHKDSTYGKETDSLP